MSERVCTCYEIRDSRRLFLGGRSQHVVWYRDGDQHSATLLHSRACLSIPMPKRRQTTERVRIVLVGNRVIEEVRNETRPTPSPGYGEGPVTGHRCDCPFYVPQRPTVSKKRKRQALREARVESDYALFGHRRSRAPSPKRISHKARPLLPRGAVKLMRERGYWKPEMVARAWYSPTKPKPIKRREKRGQSRPR